MENQKQAILAVVGPTAIGKTALSLALAERMGGEILSCDSMQVYRGMDIGTAKPTKEERARVPHHLIDIADPMHPFSCADYVAAAEETLHDCRERGILPILCGGTGLYLERLLMGGGCDAETAPDRALREELRAYAQENGSHALHEMLRAVDPESAEAIHENNLPRVIRALEIHRQTGIPKSEWDRRSREGESRYRATVIGLRCTERELLYKRIDGRVEQMLAEGLLEETRRLDEAGVFEANETAARAIGYKELLGHLRGDESLDEAKARLRLATRHYAKRQMTWFSAKEYVTWIDVDRNGEIRPFGEILQEATAILER